MAKLSVEEIRTQYNLIDNKGHAYIIDKFSLTPLDEISVGLKEAAVDYFVRDYVKRHEIEVSEEVIDRVINVITYEDDPDLDAELDMIHSYEILTSGIPYTDDEIGECGNYYIGGCDYTMLPEILEKEMEEERFEQEIEKERAEEAE